MSSFLNGRATVTSRTTFAPGVSRERALEVLHEHENFIKCDPHMLSYARIPIHSAQPVPEQWESQVLGQPSFFRVIEEIPALPKGILDKDMASIYEMWGIENGLYVRLRCPLNVFMDTSWTIEESDGRMELVEVNNDRCSRLLVGRVRSQLEINYREFHRRLQA